MYGESMGDEHYYGEQPARRQSNDVRSTYSPVPETPAELEARIVLDRRRCREKKAASLREQKFEWYIGTGVFVVAAAVGIAGLCGLAHLIYEGVTKQTPVVIEQPAEKPEQYQTK